MADAVEVYAMGIFCASVCAPNGMSGEEVARIVQSLSPAGTEAGWHVSEDPTFASGSSNPCPCNDHPEERRHWLLDC